MDTDRQFDRSFDARTQVAGDRARVILVGDLDEISRACADETLRGLACAGVRNFTIDASGLAFVGACGVHLLADLFRRQPTCVVAVTGASPTFAKLLTLAGLEEHLVQLDQRPPP